jgi:hypothetical protein
MELDMSTFPNLVGTFMNSNIVPSKQQTRVSRLWPMYEYGQTTPKDLAARAIIGCVADVAERNEKSYFERAKEIAGFGGAKSEEDERTGLHDVIVPETFGSSKPIPLLEYLKETGLSFIGGSGEDDEKMDEKMDERRGEEETDQQKIVGTIRFDDFYLMMTSRHLCAMGSCHKKKKKKKSGDGDEGEYEKGYNARSIAIEAEDWRRKDKLLAESSFVPAETFQGVKEGYYYGSREPDGLGYHRDYYGDLIGIATMPPASKNGGEEEEKRRKAEERVKKKKLSTEGTSR